MAKVFPMQVRRPPPKHLVNSSIQANLFLPNGIFVYGTMLSFVKKRSGLKLSGSFQYFSLLPNDATGTIKFTPDGIIHSPISIEYVVFRGGTAYENIKKA